MVRADELRDCRSPLAAASYAPGNPIQTADGGQARHSAGAGLPAVRQQFLNSTGPLCWQSRACTMLWQSHRQAWGVHGGSSGSCQARSPGPPRHLGRSRAAHCHKRRSCIRPRGCARWSGAAGVRATRAGQHGTYLSASCHANKTERWPIFMLTRLALPVFNAMFLKATTC